jgi:hypothetical protein
VFCNNDLKNVQLSEDEVYCVILNNKIIAVLKFSPTSDLKSLSKEWHSLGIRKLTRRQMYLHSVHELFFVIK